MYTNAFQRDAATLLLCQKVMIKDCKFLGKLQKKDEWNEVVSGIHEKRQWFMNTVSKQKITSIDEADQRFILL